MIDQGQEKLMVQDIRYGFCGSLNGTGHNKLIESGTTRKCGLTGIGVVFQEEVCHYEEGI